MTFDGPLLFSIALSSSWQLRRLTGHSWNSALALPGSLQGSEPCLTCLFLSFLHWWPSSHLWVPCSPSCGQEEAVVSQPEHETNLLCLLAESWQGGMLIRTLHISTGSLPLRSP